jgi:hypothetical protein
MSSLRALVMISSMMVLSSMGLISSVEYDVMTPVYFVGVRVVRSEVGTSALFSHEG